MFNDPHVVLAGGGALGNLYPGLAIAQQLQQQLSRVQVTFVGDGRAVERHMVRAEGYNYVAMPAKAAPTGPLEAVRYVTDNVAGFWASRWMVREQKVSLVIGMGGPASAAMLRAAHGSGIPFILLEQNATATPLTRRIAGSAQAVCAAFEELRPHLPMDAPFVLTGVPGRPAFERIAEQRREQSLDAGGLRRLVVIGGTAGSRALNEATPKLLSKLATELDGWQVVHQTGEGQLQDTEQRYAAHGVPALVVSYIDEMASLLAETDLVVCRAGGTMLSELSLSAAPAILVPTIDNQGGLQAANAEHFAQATGCPVVDQRGSSDDLAGALTQQLRPLLIDASRRAEIASAVGALARPDASQRIAEIACDALCGRIGSQAA